MQEGHHGEVSFREVALGKSMGRATGSTWIYRTTTPERRTPLRNGVVQYGHVHRAARLADRGPSQGLGAAHDRGTGARRAARADRAAAAHACTEGAVGVGCAARG